MNSESPRPFLKQRLAYIGLAVTMALACLLAALQMLRSSGPLYAQGDVRLYLPSVMGMPGSTRPPTGSYTCLEYEFGLVWTSEIITLNADGSSIYDFSPPYLTTMTGTWTYTPSIRQVGLTNFRWPTATYEAPNRLWASEYLPEPDFEVALECQRR